MSSLLTQLSCQGRGSARFWSSSASRPHETSNTLSPLQAPPECLAPLPRTLFSRRQARSSQQREVWRADGDSCPSLSVGMWVRPIKSYVLLCDICFSPAEGESVFLSSYPFSLPFLVLTGSSRASL
ncbi:hypothetical protein LEMLEM_LOCUS7407 [Lemmus lemmus]